MGIDEKIEEVEEKVENLNYATEILQDLRDNNKRLWMALVGTGLLFFISNMIWLWAWQSYDYVSSYEYSASGVNAIIDNSGNVVAQDIPSDQLQEILEILNNGESDSESNKNQD